jgi:L-lactate utilization protein LutB
MLPFFEDISSYKFAPYACLLCGNCEKVCPVLLPLKDLILENRIYLFESKNVDSSDKKRYGTYKTTAISRKKMNRSKFFRKLALKRFLTKPLRKKRKFSELSKTTFNQQYIQATQNESK